MIAKLQCITLVRRAKSREIIPGQGEGNRGEEGRGKEPKKGSIESKEEEKERRE